MKKYILLVVPMLMLITIISCAQNTVKYWAGNRQLLKEESKCITTNETEMGAYLKAMKTDSIIEKMELLSKFMHSNSEGNSLEEYTSKGLSFNNLKQYDSALKYFTKALNLNDADPYLYYFRGDTYSKMHNYLKAIDDFSKAIHLDQSFNMAFYFRGMCYYAIGDVNKAMEDLSKTFKQVKASLKQANKLLNCW